MPRSYQPVEQNTFVAGLITEASPLTFPPNASLDEQNFILNKDGSRSRRLGIDFEESFSAITGDNTIAPGKTELAVESFKWSNVDGDPNKTIICVQVGTKVDFFDGDSVPLSAGLFFSYTPPGATGAKYSFAAVDGNLVVTTGSKDVLVFTYNSITQVLSVDTKRLLIRDFFGLDDINDGIDYRLGTNISTRPTGIYTGQHAYNLMNQTWALPRASFNGNDYGQDPVDMFHRLVGKWPSNADSVIPYLYANTDATAGTKTLTRFDAENININNPENTPAPMGYFIIDALDRGDSRKAELVKLDQKYPVVLGNAGSLANALAVIPKDSTPAGASCACEYAGRVWYAGFPGSVIGGDTHSPKMSSYVLFSKLVSDPTDIVCCYQVGDPTSKDDSALVDTDGGFLRVQGAFNIIQMVNLGNLLLVFAENGVWSVQGGSSYGFTATNYKVAKITSSGCTSPGSIVVVENAAFYWSRDGIYSIGPNQYGDYIATNVTKKTVQRYYNNIPVDVANRAQGVYDSFEQQVKWIFNNGKFDIGINTELVLDVNIGAFYKLVIQPIPFTPT